ncbi:DUF3800 domain-containing protein [Tunturiibacter empetritectus]|uniref:F0F1-type ATP synthase epsilon subunit n=2 Tax=Tunturiibacter TaxID=3154218 RepID=A0A852VC71_9BACT|nr:DUF3800 domain-containing protein [Edaphobacter lichenicola]NYF88064.1 F0F1-type ATP synthase epsilon subunit [Edaphobacter lichenicola]
MLILKCYIDDSKDSKQEKVFVSAGFLANKIDWSHLTDEWNRCLIRHGIAYYKTSEYKMMKGQFERFRSVGRTTAKQIKAELQQIVKNHHQTIAGVAVAVNVQDYLKVCLRPEAKSIFSKNTYHRALESLVFQTCKKVRRDLGRKIQIAFVHDEGDDYPELLLLYKDFKKKNPKTAKMMAGFTIQDDKITPALQMADMIANNIQRKAVKSLEAGKLNKEEFEMHENIVIARIMNEEYMLNMLKRVLIIRGQPVPADLENYLG